MNSISNDEVLEYVKLNIQYFHTRRIDGIRNLKLDRILKRKNPYLYKAKNISVESDLVKSILDAYISSPEEAIFGTFLEGLAIFVCSTVYSGRKSAAEGIGLKFEKDDKNYIVSIKSGPNWGNSSQLKRMRDKFNKAKRILRFNSSIINIVAVNGCCYGKVGKYDKGEYLKLCGQRFWEFISGNENLYIEIIEPLGFETKQPTIHFKKSIPE